MKKLLVVLFAIMMATAVYGQKFYAGGSLGLASNSNSQTSSFSVMPELGYVINDKFSVGAELLLSAYTGGNTIGFKPYARYNMLTIGKVTFFTDGAIAFSKAKNYDALWEIGLYPGIAFAIDKKLSLVGHVGALSYSSSNDLKLYLNNSIATGLFFHF